MRSFTEQAGFRPSTLASTYVASKVRLPDDKPVVVRLAAAGSARLGWDGADIGVTEDLQPRLVLDRLAARLTPSAGDHLLTVKVCSGSVPDDGRVRVHRIADGADDPRPELVRRLAAECSRPESQLGCDHAE